MTILPWINSIIAVVGVPTIIGVLLLVGRKLQVLDTIHRDIEQSVKPDVKNVRERVARIEGQLKTNRQSHRHPGTHRPGKKLLTDPA